MMKWLHLPWHIEGNRVIKTSTGETIIRFVTSVIPLEENRDLQRACDEVVEHYHRERAHQGLGKEGVERRSPIGTGEVQCTERLGGILKHYRRAAQDRGKRSGLVKVVGEMCSHPAFGPISARHGRDWLPITGAGFRQWLTCASAQ